MTDVAALADKDAIRDLLHAYCRAVDRLDVPLGRAVFHADAEADYGADYYQGPARDVIDRICADHARLLGHAHRLANVLIVLDGDRAGSEAYVHGTMRAARGDEVVQIAVHARYCDRWERRDGRWGIVHRRVVHDHQDIRAVTPMPRAGTGTRDRDDPSYAVLDLAPGGAGAVGPRPNAAA